jgi:hypothetical protein
MDGVYREDVELILDVQSACASPDGKAMLSGSYCGAMTLQSVESMSF